MTDRTTFTTMEVYVVILMSDTISIIFMALFSLQYTMHVYNCYNKLITFMEFQIVIFMSDTTKFIHHGSPFCNIQV